MTTESPHIPISIVLLTTGRQALIDFSIRSLLPQLDVNDEMIVSINTGDEAIFQKTKDVVASVDPENRAEIISPPSPIPVYSHYRYGFENAKHDHVIIVHDDDIYNSKMIEEIRQGFSDPEVSVVVGGLLKIQLIDGQSLISFSDPFIKAETCNGRDWLHAQPGLYPRFCYSALAINRKMLDNEFLKPNSTAGDCLLIAQLALSGKVYQSPTIFATWSQLPFRTSRWSIIDPSLITPWIEFYQYYKKVGENLLAGRALEWRVGYLNDFVKMLFSVGVANCDPKQIEGCLCKIAEISPIRAKLLTWIKCKWVYKSLSLPLIWIKAIQKKRLASRARKEDGLHNIPRLLNIDSNFWSEFITEASSLASK